MELSDEIRARLGAHVDAVLSRSRIPRRDRPDVAEELLGHLIERYGTALGAGRVPDDAAAEAISAFGGPTEIAPAFVAAYHSRLWASTIGALLPVDTAPDEPPGVVRWSAGYLRLLAALAIVASAVILATSSPVHALVGAITSALGAAILWLTAEGLQRGRGWALPTTELVLLVEIGVLIVSWSQPGGGVRIELFGVAAAILLLAWIGARPALVAWVGSSDAIQTRLGVAIAAGLAGWIWAGAGLPGLPDPTQIGPSDISAVATVTCAPMDLEDGLKTEPLPTVVLDVAYHRADPWPFGFAANTEGEGDPVAIHLLGNGVPWMSDLVDRASGESQPGVSVSTVNPAIFPSDATAGIPIEIQIPGHPLRLTVHSTSDVADDRPDAGSPMPYDIVGVRLGHLDRFFLGVHVHCGESKPLVAGGDDGI